MRISDWSSDVCSSDLRAGDGRTRTQDRTALAGFSVAGSLCDFHREFPGRLPDRTADRRVAGRRHPYADGACRLSVSAVRPVRPARARHRGERSEEHTTELQSLMRIWYAV